MLKFEKERINFFHIYYTLVSLESFFYAYILFIDKYQADLSKTEEIFQKFAKKKKFRIFVVKIGNPSDK